MHAEAFDGARKMIAASGLDPTFRWDALDLGGADINGTARSLLPNARWTGLDQVAGPGVDIIADATTWQPNRDFDVALCTELLEHVKAWELCLQTAHTALRPGGVLILTCASTGRQPHGARGEADPGLGDWYGNVDPAEVRSVLAGMFRDSEAVYNPTPGDCYAWARA